MKAGTAIFFLGLMLIVAALVMTGHQDFVVMVASAIGSIALAIVAILFFLFLLTRI